MKCLRPVGTLFAAVALLSATAAFGEHPPSHLTKWYEVQLAPTHPAITSLWVDSLGNGRNSPNGVLPTPPAGEYRLDQQQGGATYTSADSRSATSFRFDEQQFFVRVRSDDDRSAEPFSIRFRFRGRRPAHATLLGKVGEDGRIMLPAILHIPAQGTLRITSNAQAAQHPALGYEADFEKMTITFPADMDLEYCFEVIQVLPEATLVDDDPRFDGFRRCWLNTLQLSANHRILANHAGSDPCALCYHEYSEIAMLTGAMADGVSGPRLLRDSLERLLAGQTTYGMPGHATGDYPEPSLDTYPSLLIAAHNYYQATQDDAWVERHIDKLIEWANLSLDTDSNGNGLIEYHQSGNLNDCRFRPANWWDCVNFGHEDAYSNALAYRAFGGLARLAKVADRHEDARRFQAAADKLKGSYYPTFYNPDTQMLAGWKSRDGMLHDYGFTFVQGVAITYGVVDDPKKCNQLMDATLKKMADVGYDRFDLGLPGNLQVIPGQDYYDSSASRWGGEGAFGVYENGGASANHVYYTLAALYHLGRKDQADRILFPILKSFNDGAFQGTSSNGAMTNDWRAWDGTPWGYEGFLCDNYLTVKAVLVRNGQVDPLWGTWRSERKPR